MNDRNLPVVAARAVRENPHRIPYVWLQDPDGLCTKHQVDWPGPYVRPWRVEVRGKVFDQTGQDGDGVWIYRTTAPPDPTTRVRVVLNTEHGCWVHEQTMLLSTAGETVTFRGETYRFSHVLEDSPRHMHKPNQARLYRRDARAGGAPAPPSIESQHPARRDD